MHGELDIDGKKYISSKRAAEASGYAKDYIGQLCRMGKLDAQLIGRNWYVSEASLKAHQHGEEVALVAAGASDEEGIEHVFDPSIEGMLTSTARRRIQERLASDIAVLFYPGSTQYESDSMPLLPPLIPKDVSNEVDFETAPAAPADDLSDGESPVAISVVSRRRRTIAPEPETNSRAADELVVPVVRVRHPILNMSIALTILIAVGGVALSLVTVERVAEFHNTAQAGLSVQGEDARTYYRISETRLAEIFK